MHAISRHYQVDPGSVAEIARRAEAGFVPIVSAVPGFVSYSLSDFGGGAISSFSVFQDVTGADASVARAASWVRENLSSLVPNPPQIRTAEVRFRDVKPGQKPNYDVTRVYQGADPSNVDEIVRRVRDGLVPILRDVPGYVTYVGLVGSDGTIASASSWTDQAAAEESSRRAIDWVQHNLTSLLPNPPRVRGGTILLRHATD